MGRNSEIIVTENTIQTWSLINMEEFLKIRALSDSQEEITGFR